ncbi:MAG: ATP synthase subunit I [Pseudomonadota bacterium]|nr:ATP synthase subunit I [Pseudomonadota bacterium]
MTIQRLSERQQRQAYYIVLLQLLVALVVAIILWPLTDLHTTCSILVGGLVCVVPSWYFATRFFSVTGALAAKQIATSMYRAEIGKLLLTGLLFVVVFTFLDVAVAPLFGGFILAQITGLCTPLFLRYRTVE